MDYGEHVIRAEGRSGKQVVSDEFTITIRKRAVTDLESDQLRINNKEKYICVTPFLTVETIVTLICADEGAALEVREADGLTKAASGQVTAGMTLLVTAEDGTTTALYTFVESTAQTRLSVTVSAEEAGNSADQLMDGDPNTRWSGSTGCPTDIIIDFGEPAHISQISIKWYQARAYQYTVQLSTDGKTYSTAADRSGNTEKGTLSDSFAPAIARYIKIRVSGTSDGSNWVSIYEVTTDAWWIRTTYDVDETQRIITVSYDPGVIISKEEFISALGLEGDCSAEVSTGNGATVYYITDGAKLIISCKGTVYEYTLIYR